MRTSRDAYHQIVWDDRLDPTRFSVDVDVHAERPKRVPLLRFEPDGEIPWHRVLALRCDDTVCWSRDGIDTLDRLASSGLFAPRLLGPPFWEPRTAVRHDGASWLPWTGAEETRETLVLLTWNVLWDRFHADTIRSSDRWPVLIDEALASGADVIGFQEVTHRFHALVLAHPQVRASWWVSHPADHPDIGAADLLLIGRVPVRELGFCRLRPHKAALGAVLGCGPLVITTHLSSDHSRNAAARREEELRRIQVASDLGRGSIWMGDYNLSAEEPLLDTRDAWTAVAAPEPTFDPVRNPLAVHSSRTGRPVRIDRVLLRGPYTPLAAGRLGLATTDGVHPSDHYGVRVELKLASDEAVWLGPCDRRSALAFVPRDVAHLEQIRSHRDPAFGRWPPHLNLLWPFVAEADLDEAIAALPPLEPFRAVLDRPGTFPGRRPVQFLGPADASPWEACTRTLRRRFPTAGAPGAPHLTLARDDAPVEGVVDEPMDRWVVLTRRGEGPYEARGCWTVDGWEDVVERWPFEPARPWPRPLPAGAVLTGSRRLGVALDGADLDLVFFGDEASARQAFEEWGEARAVERAGRPGLVIGDVDVVLVPEGADADHPDDAVVQALSAIGDADALLARMQDRLPLYREVLRWVKAWARAQELDRGALGGVEGLAWAVLVAESLGHDDLDTELRRFFATWAAWDWSEGVGMPAVAPVTIATPSEPMRCITQRARRPWLESALWAAWEAMETDGREALLVRPRWHREHAEAVLVRSHDAEVRGRALSRARALIDLLGEVRPRALVDGFALGLPRGVDGDHVDEVLAAWADGAVEVRRVPTWEVP